MGISQALEFMEVSYPKESSNSSISLSVKRIFKKFLRVVIVVVLRLGIPLDIGIIGFILRDGEGQLAAGIDLTEEDICQSTAAFHTGIVGKEDSLPQARSGSGRSAILERVHHRWLRPDI